MACEVIVVQKSPFTEKLGFWRKNGQNLAQSSRKWHKKNQIGETGGERKKKPSANPVVCLIYADEGQKVKFQLLYLHFILFISAYLL